MGVVGRLDQYASMLAGEFDDYSMSENLLTYSEDFSNASWGKSAGSVSSNLISAPDGTITADAFIEDTSTNAYHYFNKSITKAASSITYTFSTFIQSKGGRRIGIRLQSSGSNGAVSVFDLVSGTIATAAFVYGTGFSNASSSITQYPNNWYRIVLTVTSDTATSLQAEYFLQNGASAVYTGDGTSGIYIWGAQLETGSVPTDYTPTTDTAINRVLASTTNTNITGLGTYYSSGFDENVGFTTFLSANVFAPYDPVYDEFSGTLFGAGQGRYMRQNTDKSVIVYNEIDEVSDFRDIVRTGLILDIDMQQPLSYTGRGLTLYDLSGNNNNATAVTTLGVANDAPGTVISLDTSSEIRVNLTANINKYAFTFSYWGRPTAIPDSNYQTICRLIDTSSVHGYYFNMDTREVATPSVLHYVKDYATNNWDTRQMITNAEYLNYKWHYYTLVMFAENDWKSYLDGQLLGTNTTPSQDLSSYGDINRVYFGGSSCNFNIANFSMYNISLTSTQILQNYNALRHRFGL
jgi:hypothetical protein